MDALRVGGAQVVVECDGELITCGAHVDAKWRQPLSRPLDPPSALSSALTSAQLSCVLTPLWHDSSLLRLSLEQPSRGDDTDTAPPPPPHPLCAAMASLLARLRSAASSVSPSSASFSSPSSASASTSFIKRSMYRNPVMSLSIVLGTIGLGLPLCVYFVEGPRPSAIEGNRLRPYLDRLDEMEQQRKERILRELKDIQGEPRVDALREQLQKSPKYQHAQ